MFPPLRRIVASIALLSVSALAQTSQQPLTFTVRDTAGHPVSNLKPSDLSLTLGNQPQAILSLSQHTPPTQPAPALNLPPGTFTDYTPVPPDATLNILLLDALNTPTASSADLRAQLQQIIADVSPDTHLAIFGLAQHVILLQSFDPNPQPLTAALGHQLIPRTLASPSTNGAPTATLLAANLQQFESQLSSVETGFHPQLTLDALQALAHYLSGLPGRKNLLWLSASFPAGLLTDDTQPSDLNPAELRETRALLAAAQVSIYPIDTRPLLPPKLSKALAQSPAAEHAVMTQIAASTGGEPFFDTTNLPATVNRALQSGADYYTLTFTPLSATSSPSTSQSTTGLPIHLTLNTPQATNLRLAYPRTLYANTPSTQTPDAYTNAAMARGAPTPSDLLFKVRVLPASTAAEPDVAPGNLQNPDYRVLGPFQRFVIDFILPPGQFNLSPQPAGPSPVVYTGKLDYFAFAYDIDGRLLTTEAKTVTLKLPAAEYARFASSPLSLHLEISVPLRLDSYLRLGIHDRDANRFGVVELPASTVSHLPPPATPPAGRPQAP